MERRRIQTDLDAFIDKLIAQVDETEEKRNGANSHQNMKLVDERKLQLEQEIAKSKQVKGDVSTL